MPMPGASASGIVGEQRHERRGRRGAERGDGDQRGAVHAGVGQDARVHRQDVGHGGERGDAGLEFAAGRCVPPLVPAVKPRSGAWSILSGRPLRLSGARRSACRPLGESDRRAVHVAPAPAARPGRASARP